MQEFASCIVKYVDLQQKIIRVLFLRAYFVLFCPNDRLYCIVPHVFINTALSMSDHKSSPPISAKWQGHVLQFVGTIGTSGRVSCAKQGFSSQNSGHPSSSSFSL